MAVSEQFDKIEFNGRKYSKNRCESKICLELSLYNIIPSLISPLKTSADRFI